MKLILSLLKRTMIELRDIYTKLELDGLLDEKEDSTSMELIDTESSEREAADNELNDRIEANKANDEAMANVVKWGVYASAMQKMVDEEMAELIRQEFEKAKEEYLADPTAEKEWVTIKNATEFSTTNPYYDEPPTRPVIDFNVVIASGSSAYNVGSFNGKTNVPVFLPSATNINSIFAANTVFNSALIAPEATNAALVFANAIAFNQPLSFPVAPRCDYLVYKAKKFNSKLNIPNAENCLNMVRGATSFNQPLLLPKATNCLNMLYGATSFNQPLSLPKATNCSYMLRGATSFNSTLELPVATNCSYMLKGATAFNQPLSLLKAANCSYLLEGATAFNQVVSLPSASDCTSAFTNTAMSAENISATLDSLPTWTSGSHVITFTGSHGAAELTQESPSVAAAVAKGWTVEL